jgi:hypothetical protein
MEELNKRKFYRKRKHFELDSGLETKMSTLTITKKLKTSPTTLELISYTFKHYNLEEEQRMVEQYYKEKNRILSTQMFGNN